MQIFKDNCRVNKKAWIQEFFQGGWEYEGVFCLYLISNF